MRSNDKRDKAIDARLLELADTLRTLAAWGDKLSDRDIGACADAAAVLDDKARPTHSDKLYRLKDGDIVDSEGRRITIVGNRGIVQLLNERDQLKRALDKQIELNTLSSATTAQHDAEKRIAVIEECRAAVFHRFRKATQHSLVKSVLEVLDSLKKAQH